MEIDVTRVFVLTRSQYMQMVPGKTIEVALDPSDPESVVIIWS